MENKPDKTITDLKRLMEDFEYMIEEAVISDYYFSKGNMDPETTRALIVYDIGLGKIDMSRMQMLDAQSQAHIHNVASQPLPGDFTHLQQNQMGQYPVFGQNYSQGQPRQTMQQMSNTQSTQMSMNQSYGVPQGGAPVPFQQQQPPPQQQEDPLRMQMPDFKQSVNAFKSTAIQVQNKNTRSIVQKPSYPQQQIPQQQPSQSCEVSAFAEPSGGESKVPQLQGQNAPSIDISEDLFRETLLQMRIKLGSDTPMLASCKTIHTMLNNISKNPLEEKYRKIRLTNDKIKQDIGKSDQACFLLEMIGFEKMALPFTNKQGQTSNDAHYVLLRDRQDLRELQTVIKILDELLQANSVSPLMAKLGHLRKTTQGGPVTSKQISKMSQVEKIANNNSIAKNRLAEAAAARENRNIYYPEIAEQQKQIAKQYQNYDTIEGQLKYYKQCQQQRTQRQKPRELTLNDTQRMVDDDTRRNNDAQSAGKGASEQMGIRALELTNNFRKEHNLPALSWNQALHDIAAVHSQDMGVGKVPFSHDGFSERANKVPFFKRSFSENVAYNMGCADAVETAVRGWINSPGHRKNMLATNTVCGIAVFNNGGAYYFTQLFALA